MLTWALPSEKAADPLSRLQIGCMGIAALILTHWFSTGMERDFDAMMEAGRGGWRLGDPHIRRASGVPGTLRIYPPDPGRATPPATTGLVIWRAI